LEKVTIKKPNTMKIIIENNYPKYSLFLVKPYQISELAVMYGISVRTFHRWIKPLREKLGKGNGNFLSIKQVEIIIQHFDLPYYIKTEIIDEKMLGR
jgi:hypothetical protein